MAPIAPQVSYEKGQLTIVASNSTLGDVLRAVRKQTGAEIDIPDAKERVVTHLGPGPAREVIAELLNGSRFNYVLLGSPEDVNVLTRVVLVAKMAAPPSGIQLAAQQQAAMRQPGIMAPPPPQDISTDASETNGTDDPEDAAPEQPAAEVEQPAANPDQPTVKTPQQLLQEMQQRQLQMQQQQQSGQPVPGQPPVPPAQRPPQEQQ
jgi:flagellar biosynthesis GTPase FlhF